MLMGVVVDDLVVFSANNGISVVPIEDFGFSLGGQFDVTGFYENPKWRPVLEAIADAIDVDRARLLAAVKIASDHWQHPLVVEACCGGRGPLADRGVITFEEFQRIVADYESEQHAAAARRNAKKLAIRARRIEFGGRRPSLVLAMLDAGIPYRCSYPGCDIIERLTVDHITPVSRGGTDDLANLQFLCGPHNSAKGSRTP